MNKEVFQQGVKAANYINKYFPTSYMVGSSEFLISYDFWPAREIHNVETSYYLRIDVYPLNSDTFLKIDYNISPDCLKVMLKEVLSVIQGAKESTYDLKAKLIQLK